ncbi:hypothetical protein Esti_003469 [Eimeria stiedai]
MSRGCRRSYAAFVTLTADTTTAAAAARQQAAAAAAAAAVTPQIDLSHGILVLLQQQQRQRHLSVHAVYRHLGQQQQRQQ